jgi:hypothetical protein
MGAKEVYFRPLIGGVLIPPPRGFHRQITLYPNNHRLFGPAQKADEVSPINKGDN